MHLLHVLDTWLDGELEEKVHHLLVPPVIRVVRMASGGRMEWVRTVAARTVVVPMGWTPEARRGCRLAGVQASRTLQSARGGIRKLTVREHRASLEELVGIEGGPRCIARW